MFLFEDAEGRHKRLVGTHVLIAGLTVAMVVVPQAMAYALIAELPPQMGLYTAIVAAIVGALWGSSNQLQTGPTNAASLLVLSILAGVDIDMESGGYTRHLEQLVRDPRGDRSHIHDRKPLC